MRIYVHKEPIFENDQMLIEIKDFFLEEETLNSLLAEDPYLDLKMKKFSNKDTSIRGFETFYEDRPSLRNLENLDGAGMIGSIYTTAVQIKNGCTYESALELIRDMLPFSRKKVIRIADSLPTYHASDKLRSIDVSCLNIIHYFGNTVKFMFRASDVKNELFADIITLYTFFVLPLYPTPVEISIYASTVQNYRSLSETLLKIGELKT